jgi:hypothetical protein
MIYSLSNQKDLNDAAFQTGQKKIKWEAFMQAFISACKERSRTAKKVEDYLIPTFDFEEARMHYSNGFNNPPTLIRK